ncbi:MAG: 2'-deoxycytidine 5'-triphosphate deaminase [Paracoccaceae bacterium]|nr:2'-deoxycytidine 5'-triphosphate deaminase [Paracoccaceae bacterium]
MLKPLTKFPRSVLPCQEIRKLITNRVISSEASLNPMQIQPSSIDLRLSSRAWRMRASFLPGKKRKVKTLIDQLAMQEINLDKGYILEKGSVYLVKLQESLELPNHIEALGNAKSSTGRLDLFTRLITDHGTEFDRVNSGYSGPLYAEIAPNSFSVFAKKDTMLNQIRFKIQHDLKPKKSEILENLESIDKQIVGSHTPAKDFSINLRNPHNNLVGYKAKRHTDLIDLTKINHYKIADFWDKVTTKRGRIVLDPGAFYILSSREYVSVPPKLAAEMAPYLSMIGEFRVHYAGFFDPGFGYSPNGSQKSRAVLEVRCHETPFVLEHGQTVGRLKFENMFSEPDLLYGKGVKSNYQGQSLKLSKHFKD